METSSVEAPTAAEKETQTQQEPVEVPILTRCTKVERKELIPSEKYEFGLISIQVPFQRNFTTSGRGLISVMAMAVPQKQRTEQ